MVAVPGCHCLVVTVCRCDIWFLCSLGLPYYNLPVLILISAGEASGEMYGAGLIEAMRRLEPSAEFFGVGGERMRAAGCDTVVDTKDLAVVESIAVPLTII